MEGVGSGERVFNGFRVSILKRKSILEVGRAPTGRFLTPLNHTAVKRVIGEMVKRIYFMLRVFHYS